MSAVLAELALEAGLTRHYWDGAGRETWAPDDTLRAVLAAMDLPAETDAEAAESLSALRATRAARRLPPWVVAEAGRPVRVPFAGAAALGWRLELEDGSLLKEGEAEGEIALPALPMGYHWLSAGSERAVVLAAPASLPDVPRGWGVMAPIYGLKPEGQGAIGDYADLGHMAAALAGHGAGFLGINPVHAGFPQDPRSFSPYSPSHRGRYSTLHIHVPGAPELPADGPLVDYAAVLSAQETALEAAFEAFQRDPDPAFAIWRQGEGEPLEQFALHQALSERHGAFWPRWPAGLEGPDTLAARSFAAQFPERVTAHCWRQWIAGAQMAEAQASARSAGMRHGLYLDLAVGTHPDGAEVWADPDLFAHGVSLGAPPDDFAPQAQVWALAPMRPDRLIERGFAPLVQILRRQLRYSGILRIDHILGFERAFWVPAGGSDGAYVAMPRDALLALARIEATRADAVIVGEDLGVIPDGLRAALSGANIFGCRVAMFERHWQGDGSFIAPADYPERVMASFGSHDLPLWRGWRAGRDIDWRIKLGDMAEAEAEHARVARARDVAGFDRATAAPCGDYVGPARFLAQARARLVALQLEDIMEAHEQPNLPGTVYDHPNWRRRLPRGAETLTNDINLKQIAAIMAENRR